MRLELSSGAPGKDPNRRYARLKSDITDVVLLSSTGDRQSCQVVDESFGGIGIRFENRPRFEDEQGLREEQEVEVCYNGVETYAIVRHAGPDESGGYRVGLEWKAQGLATIARDLGALRARDAEDDKIGDFLRILPGGIYMMWKIFEAEKWLELSDTMERLRKAAHVSGIRSLDGLIDRVQAILEAPHTRGDLKQVVRQQVGLLFEECIRIAKEEDLVTAGADDQI